MKLKINIKYLKVRNLSTTNPIEDKIIAHLFSLSLLCIRTIYKI